MERKTELNIIIGINGSGKTTFIRDKVLPNRKRSIIITPDEMEWTSVPFLRPSEIKSFEGPKRIMAYPDNFNSIIELLKKEKYANGSIILDDCKSYIKSVTDETLRYLYIRRRQFNIDIYLVAHGLRQVPPEAFTFASWLILFNSVENFSARKGEVLPETYQTIIEAQKEIKMRVKNGDPYLYKIILLDEQIRGIYEYNNKRKNNG